METRRINLTQHDATPNQGCMPRSPKLEEQIKDLLTFNEIPTREEIISRAEALANIAAQEGAVEAMIGGAPYLMAELEYALYERGIMPVYSFSVRQSEDMPQPDGSVKKVSVFRHIGWVHVK